MLKGIAGYSSAFGTEQTLMVQSLEFIVNSGDYFTFTANITELEMSTENPSILFESYKMFYYNENGKLITRFANR